MEIRIAAHFHVDQAIQAFIIYASLTIRSERTLLFDSNIIK